MRYLGAFTALALAFSSFGPAFAASCGGIALQAHRGGPEGPENSLTAIRSAADAGFSMTEIDVQLLADGAWALHHDATTGRVVGGFPKPTFLIESDKWKSRPLKGRDGEPAAGSPALLSEALNAAYREGIALNIEIKGKFSCAAVRDLARQVTDAPGGRGHAFTSADKTALECVRAAAPNAYVGAVVAPGADALAEKHADALSKGRELASKLGFDTSKAERAAKKAYSAFDNDELLSPSGARAVASRLGPDAGLHVPAEALKRTRWLRAAREAGLTVVTYSTEADDRRHARALATASAKPDGAIVEGRPDAFCRSLR